MRNSDKQNQQQNNKINDLNDRINLLLETQDKYIMAARLDANLTQRAVIKGKISEEIAPLLNNFPYEMSCCKFLGQPVDYLIFPQMDQENIEEVIFLEVKSGDSVLNNRQRQIKKAIEEKRVKFEEFRIE